jgi:ATP/maltotriose-dependent transcriptional regulator MalT
VIACERIGDLERAAAWCARMQALAARVRFNALLGVCHAQYAGVLMSRGAWREAELELEAAIQRLAASRPAMQQDAHVRLAELRRRQGRFAEAHALLVPLDGHPNAELVRAALALDRRDPRAALQIAERFLRRMPPSNRTDRVRALDLLHRACLALGQRLDAARAEEELHRIAIGIGTAPLRACALAAEARARAADDREAARRAFEDAVDLYRRCGARYEHACVQRELGELLLALGERDSGHVELRAARDAFHEMGAVWHGEQVAALLHGAGLAGTASSARGAGGLTRREIQVLRLVAEGSSNRRIARTLAVSDFTIKRHVANILLKLDLPSRAAAAAYAAKARLA